MSYTRWAPNLIRFYVLNCPKKILEQSRLIRLAVYITYCVSLYALWTTLCPSMCHPTHRIVGNRKIIR